MLDTILAEFPPAPGASASETRNQAGDRARRTNTPPIPGVECAVLVVHPSLAVRAAVLDVTRERDMHSAGFSDLAAAGHYFRSGGRCSVLFCAFPLPEADLDFAEFVSLLRGNEPAVQVIAIARDSSAETIRESMRSGVLDCLSDPPVPAAIHRSLLHALHVRRLALANLTLERAREAERHHYESMLENASAAIVETTTDLEVTYMNRAAERLLGRTAAGLVGRCLVESLYPDSDYAMGVREIYESTIRSGLVPEHIFTTTVSLTDQTSRSVRWSARVYDHASNGKRILSVGEDMTAAAQLEERVRSLINELNRKNHELTLTNGKNERLQQLVRQYVPQSTWRRADLHAARGSIQIPIEQMELTCLFMDVAGFTAFTENSPIEDVVAFLNEVFAGIARIVDSFGGDIDKFMGDACFAVFESPLDACKAALRIQRFMGRLNARRAASGAAPLQLRCGINTGAVIRGNVGGTSRKDNTLIGDSVNTASRIETACGPGRVLIGETTYRQVAEQVDVSGTEELLLRGKTRSTQVYYIRNILAPKGETSP